MNDIKREVQETISQEAISALVDGELSNKDMVRGFAACNSDEGRHIWAVYHQIGDVLRSKELAIALSDSFDARMRARLAAEMHVGAEHKPPVRRWLDMGGLRVRWQHLTRHGVTVSGVLAMAAMAVVVVNLTASNPRINTVGTPLVERIDVDAPVAAAENSLVDYMTAHKRHAPSLYSAGDGRVPAEIMTGAN
jgi:negative regulator of sigma E activity